MAESWLEIGGFTVVRSEEGALDCEYALFDPGDIELAAAAVGNVRETGYRVSVLSARARLAYLGATLAHAREAGEAMRKIAPAYARGSAVRRVSRLFGATELFEGGTYDARRGVYKGTWMDLPSLARDLDLPQASTALQALYLAAVLHEAPDDAIVMLHTAPLTENRRPGVRTHRRPDLDSVGKIAAQIRKVTDMRPTPTPEREAGPTRVELVQAIRDRQAWFANADAQIRLARIEGAASAREQPAKGPLADPELWTLEMMMSDSDASGSDASGVLEKIEALEKVRGRTPITTYLRARASLMLGMEEASVIAARVSAMALSMTNFAELQLLAAQAWLAAGDAKRAMPYARDLVESTTADPEVRARAQELMNTAIERGAPVSPSAPPPAPQPARTSAPAPPKTIPPPVEAPKRASSIPSRYMVGASQPPYRADESARVMHVAVEPPPAYPESAEYLSFPRDAATTLPAPDALPRSPAEARTLFTHLSRELGRDYRLHRGVDLRTDAHAIEAMQAYLFDTYYTPKIRTHDDWLDVRRHGAFLSEIIARTLHAVWVEVSKSDLGYWAMAVPCGVRIWPFARVLRYIAMGPKERDLVSYYLELGSLTRGN